MIFFGLILSVFSTVAQSKETGVSRKPNQSTIELSPEASKIVGNLLRGAEKSGNKAIKFQGGADVTTYTVGNLSCWFQNSDDSVSCTAN